ncbi:hypothetical protein CRUP_027327 [Coryphaenoides rupestris]|nr:hypothetical protein CRUP_027327 [Coryphaenoides rupestris]
MVRHGSPRPESRSQSRWSSPFPVQVPVLVLVLVLVVLMDGTRVADAVTEPGKWIINVDAETLKTQTYFVFPKTLFNNSIIRMTMMSESCDHTSPFVLNISWYLRSSSCYDQVFNLEPKEAGHVFRATAVGEGAGSGSFVFHQYHAITCQDLMIPHTFGLQKMTPPTRLREPTQPEPITVAPGRRRRRNPSSPPPTMEVDSSLSMVVTKPLDAVARSWEDGPYWFIVHIREDHKQPEPEAGTSPWILTMEISMKGPYDFISASEHPLMLFYAVMCVVYVLLAVSWLAVSSCYWRDLLRIQFWIGGVVFLGMVEKAVYYAEYQSLRDHGLSVQGAVVLAEVVSAVKRTLARVLVIIASLGYGIVKLGALLHRVVGVGLLYLLFSIIEGILRVHADWGELWIDDAFWRFLFSMILLVIMFLWRPSANNQRYAFSPLGDEESEEEEQEAMLNEAFEGMKMRGAKTESNGTKPNKVVSK